jgi:hypothetical protein
MRALEYSSSITPCVMCEPLGPLLLEHTLRELAIRICQITRRCPYIENEQILQSSGYANSEHVYIGDIGVRFFSRSNLGRRNLRAKVKICNCSSPSGAPTVPTPPNTRGMISFRGPTVLV